MRSDIASSLSCKTLGTTTQKQDEQATVIADIAFLENLLVRLNSVKNYNSTPKAELDSNEKITKHYEGFLHEDDSKKLKILLTQKKSTKKPWNPSTKTSMPPYNISYLRLVAKRKDKLDQVTSKLSLLKMTIL